jgi:transcriptional regulator with XRE-family HTH domain
MNGNSEMSKTQVRSGSIYSAPSSGVTLRTTDIARKISPVPLIATISLYGALVAGTGGVFANVNATELPNWTNHPIVEIRALPITLEAASQLAPSVAEQLQLIRNGFGLKMSELAQIFGVSRQAAYSWLGGTIPKPELVARIWALSKSADQVRGIGVKGLENFLHRPLLQDGRTLFAILLEGSQVDEVVIALRHTASLEAQVRSQSSLRNPGIANERRSSFVEMVKPILDEGRR